MFLNRSERELEKNFVYKNRKIEKEGYTKRLNVSVVGLKLKRFIILYLSARAVTTTMII